MRFITNLCALLLVSISCFTTSSVRGEDRPNIILILADDLGVEGLNCYGGTSYRTPRLDKLASQGIRFTQAHAQPLCTNTRTQLMTGLYNHRNWLYFGCLDPKSKTIGHYLQEAGYQTCIAGKWQLHSYDPLDYPGAKLRRGKGMHPKDAGFHQYSLWHTGHTEDKGSRYADPVIDENGKTRKYSGKYGEDVWVEFIQQFMAKQAKAKQPFFVYYPMALPHWPFVPTPQSKDWGIEEKMHPPLGTTGGDVKYFPDMVSYMDQVVGRIVDSLDDLGIADNTLIVYYSDNGTDQKVISKTVFGHVQGGKGLTTDAGTHVPLIVRWPQKIKPGICEDLVDSTDLLPTLLAASGHQTDSNIATDGLSFLPQLLGKKGPKREWSFCHYDPRPGWDKDRFSTLRFARTKRFKLYTDGRFYDIANDRLESRPMAQTDDSSVAAKDRKLLKKVLETMDSQ